MGKIISNIPLLYQGSVHGFYNANDHFSNKLDRIGVMATGGVDSTAVLAIAKRIYGAQHVQAITINAKPRLDGTHPYWYSSFAKKTADILGIIHREVEGFDGNFTSSTSIDTTVTRVISRLKILKPDIDGFFIGTTTNYYRSNIKYDFLTNVDLNINQVFIPFLRFYKKDSLSILQHLEPDLIKETYSCSTRPHTHCGKCYCCLERRRGFDEAGIPDPTVYEVDPYTV